MMSALAALPENKDFQTSVKSAWKKYVTHATGTDSYDEMEEQNLRDEFEKILNQKPVIYKDKDSGRIIVEGIT